MIPERVFLDMAYSLLHVPFTVKVTVDCLLLEYPIVFDTDGYMNIIMPREKTFSLLAIQWDIYDTVLPDSETHVHQWLRPI